MDDCFYTATGYNLWKWDLRKREKTKINFKSTPYKINEEKIKILTILPITNNRVIIGTSHGLMLFNNYNESLLPIQYNESDYSSAPIHLTNSIAYSGGNIWVATTKEGLKRYSLNTNTLYSYVSDILDSTALWGNTTTCVFISKNGTVWTAGTGLNKYNPKNDGFEHFTTDNELTSNDILGISEDSHQNLWLITSNGISVFNPKFENFKTIYIDQQNLFIDYTGAIKALNDSRMAIGPTKGLYIINPDSILHQKIKHNIQITNIVIHDKTIGFNRDYQQNTIFDYPENTISFEFASLDYFNTKNLIYEYRLLGFDPKWITTGANSRIARFTGLPAGNYIFEVRVKNNPILKEKNTIQYKFSIRKPSWQKLWFIALSILFFTIPVLLFIYLRVSKLRQEKRSLVLEQQLLRSQMNPHFIYNSLGAIQSYILNHNPLDAAVYLSKISDLVRHILQNSREERISFAQEIATLKNYLDLQMLRFENKFEFSIEYDNQKISDTLMIPPMLAQPFIENSIEHGFNNIDYKGQIRIEFILEDKQLIYKITDNGIGINKSNIKKSNKSEHTSLGTIISKNRIENLKKTINKDFKIDITDLSITNKDSHGTMVEILISLNN